MGLGSLRGELVTPTTVAGITAALSPRLPWAKNLDAVEDVYAGRQPKTLGASARAARRILNGTPPLDVLTGPKVANFYRGLIGDTQAVCLDVHMFRLAGVEQTSDVRLYSGVAASLRRAARGVGVPPRDFQAGLWCHVRGTGE